MCFVKNPNNERALRMKCDLESEGEALVVRVTRRVAQLAGYISTVIRIGSRIVCTDSLT